MDKKTIEVYNSGAQKYAEDWLSQPTPLELHQAVIKYFTKNGKTADIGAGSGRDTAWLNDNNYPCVGFDASEGLLKSAKEKFPHVTFCLATLPFLNEIPSLSFENVLCETVMQHLPQSEHEEAVLNLIRILKPSGRLLLSVRHPSPGTLGNREKDDRLYTLLDAESILPNHGKVLEIKTFISSSSGKKITQAVVEKL